MSSKKKFLDEYSFEQICDQIKRLSIYENPYDQFLFIQAATNSLRHEWRQEKGIDVLSLTTIDEIARYAKLALDEHPNLENTMALIVVTSALKNELKDIVAARRE